MAPSSSLMAPAVESSRLAALNALALLDSEPEKEFDALVALAAQLLGCPTALLNLVDRDRLWIKASARPTETRELQRDIRPVLVVVNGSRQRQRHRLPVQVAELPVERQRLRQVRQRLIRQTHPRVQLPELVAAERLTVPVALAAVQVERLMQVSPRPGQPPGRQVDVAEVVEVDRLAAK